MSLDHPGRLLDHLNIMQLAGRDAHATASEDGGLTGPFRDLLFGLNSIIDSLEALVEAELDRTRGQR